MLRWPAPTELGRLAGPWRERTTRKDREKVNDHLGTDISEELRDDSDFDGAADDAAVADATDYAEEASREYLGRWIRLVSTTNWEKGRIICDWRRQLMEAGAPQAVWSDEAWAHRVGNVSGQHVGRLRRVWEQFGEVYEQYAGLSWSHFQSALDWPDAEMWLQGAVESRWSVSQMRERRTATLGEADPADAAAERDDAEMDEDAGPAGEPAAERSPPDTIHGSTEEVFGPDFGDETDPSDDRERSEAVDAAPFDAGREDRADADVARPLANVPKLPEDLAEAFESFKLAIVHHRINGWNEVACGDVAAALEALKQYALTPLEA